ncbi:unnamed protein product [Leptosia nina]|uniref:Phosphatidylinositol-glycan biosynthesis class X protein n=1 Tax=Leptosia nina TaxID=320188 RepID=A0AAV1K087_9NEOP
MHDNKFLSKTIIAISLILLHRATGDICKFNIKLIQTLHSEGFHRNITYEITFGTPEDDGNEYEGCSVGLEQILPAGLYANPDELEELRYKTPTVFKDKVDIEGAAEISTPITVHLLGSVYKHRVLLSLPVHARYHKAVAGGGSARVNIPTPKFFINCGPKKLEKCVEVSSTNSFCPRSQNKCFWKHVPITVGEGLSWYVPRGDTNHHNLAMFGTAVVIAFGSLYLLKQIHFYNIRQHRAKKED